MAKGGVLTKEDEGQIINIKVKYPDWTAKEVRNEVAKILGTGTWPGVSKVTKVLGRFKVNEKAKREKAKQEGRQYITDESPWSITASFATEVNIPPEAIGDLLAVWKLSLMAARKFTIREAKWVARLRSALPGVTPKRLYEVAIAYARLDQTAQGQVPFPGTDLDAELAFHRDKDKFHDWEYEQAVWAGVVPLSGGLIKPRYINEDPTAHERGPVLPSYWPIPELQYQLFFQDDAIRLLKEVGGDDVEREPWFDHAVGVMTFWRRQLDSKLGGKLASALQTSDNPKVESTEAWGAELAAAVIAGAKASAESSFPHALEDLFEKRGFDRMGNPINGSKTSKKEGKP